MKNALFFTCFPTAFPDTRPWLGFRFPAQIRSLSRRRTLGKKSYGPPPQQKINAIPHLRQSPPIQAFWPTDKTTFDAHGPSPARRKASVPSVCADGQIRNSSTRLPNFFFGYPYDDFQNPKHGQMGFARSQGKARRVQPAARAYFRQHPWDKLNVRKPALAKPRLSWRLT